MMCLIIDTCTFHAVFNTASASHSRFAPVLEWLKGGGRIIIGGTKYKKELSGTKFQSILTEYEKKGRVVKIDDRSVDLIAAQLKRKIPDQDFDDEHLIAMVSVARCRVICTDDQRAFPYLKRKDLYPRDVKRPKIYRSSRNAALCCSDHIVDICR